MWGTRVPDEPLPAVWRVVDGAPERASAGLPCLQVRHSDMYVFRL